MSRELPLFPIDDAAHMLEQFTRIDQEQRQFAAHGSLASMHVAEAVFNVLGVQVH